MLVRPADLGRARVPDPEGPGLALGAHPADRPGRIARRWLVLAVATLWTVATGTREEDAERLGREPAHLRVALPPPPGPCQRATSVFARGLARLRWQLLRVRRLWGTIWLWPEPWPEPPPGLQVVIAPGAESLHD